MSSPASSAHTSLWVDRQTPIGPSPRVHPKARVVDCRIGQWTDIGPGWSLLESEIGDYSYAAGSDGVIHYCRVGKFCSIASHVAINPGDHPVDRVTQHHLTYRCAQYDMGSDDASVFHRRRSKSCRIGHDVWIGHGAKIMAGVDIGIGAVVGSGAVVTRDVAPYQMVAGVPARPIRMRFNDTVISRLLSIAWWKWDHETLRRRLKDLSDMDRFLSKYG